MAQRSYFLYPGRAGTDTGSNITLGGTSTVTSALNTGEPESGFTDNTFVESASNGTQSTFDVRYNASLTARRTLPLTVTAILGINVYFRTIVANNVDDRNIVAIQLDAFDSAGVGRVSTNGFGVALDTTANSDLVTVYEISVPQDGVVNNPANWYDIQTSFSMFVDTFISADPTNTFRMYAAKIELIVEDSVPNDLVSGAIVLPPTIEQRVHNIGATTDAGLPSHQGSNVWFKWYPRSVQNGTTQSFALNDSRGYVQDASLALFTGPNNATSVGQLTPVADDDDAGGNGNSLLSAVIDSNKVYFISAGSYQTGQQGDFTLVYGQPGTVAPTPIVMSGAIPLSAQTNTTATAFLTKSGTAALSAQTNLSVPKTTIPQASPPIALSAVRTTGVLGDGLRCIGRTSFIMDFVSTEFGTNVIDQSQSALNATAFGHFYLQDNNDSTFVSNQTGANASLILNYVNEDETLPFFFPKNILSIVNVKSTVRYSRGATGTTDDDNVSINWQIFNSDFATLALLDGAYTYPPASQTTPSTETQIIGLENAGINPANWHNATLELTWNYTVNNTVNDTRRFRVIELRTEVEYIGANVLGEASLSARGDLTATGMVTVRGAAALSVQTNATAVGKVTRFGVATTSAATNLVANNRVAVQAGEFDFRQQSNTNILGNPFPRVLSGPISLSQITANATVAKVTLSKRFSAARINGVNQSNFRANNNATSELHTYVNDFNNGLSDATYIENTTAADSFVSFGLTSSSIARIFPEDASEVTEVFIRLVGSQNQNANDDTITSDFSFIASAANGSSLLGYSVGPALNNVTNASNYIGNYTVELTPDGMNPALWTGALVEYRLDYTTALLSDDRKLRLHNFFVNAAYTSAPRSGPIPLSVQTNVASTGQVTQVAKPALTAETNLTAVGIRTQFGVAALTTQTNTTATGTRTQFGVVALTANGNTTAVGTRTQFASAALTASGDVSAIGTRVQFGSAALTTQSDITAVGTRAVISSPIASSANTSVNAVGLRTVLGVASLTGDTAVVPVATLVTFASSSLSATGNTTAVGTHTQFASAALTGDSSLTAVGTRTQFSPPIAFSANTALTATGAVSIAGQAALTENTSATASGTVSRLGVVTLSGNTNLTAVGKRTQFGVVLLTPGTAITAVGTVVKRGAAALSAQTSLTAIPAAFTLTGKATFTADINLIVNEQPLNIKTPVSLSSNTNLTAVGRPVVVGIFPLVTTTNIFVTTQNVEHFSSIHYSARADLLAAHETYGKAALSVNTSLAYTAITSRRARPLSLVGSENITAVNGGGLSTIPSLSDTSYVVNASSSYAYAEYRITPVNTSNFFTAAAFLTGNVTTRLDVAPEAARGDDILNLSYYIIDEQGIQLTESNFITYPNVREIVTLTDELTTYGMNPNNWTNAAVVFIWDYTQTLLNNNARLRLYSFESNVEYQPGVRETLTFSSATNLASAARVSVLTSPTLSVATALTASGAPTYYGVAEFASDATLTAQTRSRVFGKITVTPDVAMSVIGQFSRVSSAALSATTTVDNLGYVIALAAPTTLSETSTLDATAASVRFSEAIDISADANLAANNRVRVLNNSVAFVPDLALEFATQVVKLGRANNLSARTALFASGVPSKVASVELSARTSLVPVSKVVISNALNLDVSHDLAFVDQVTIVGKFAFSHPTELDAFTSNATTAAADFLFTPSLSATGRQIVVENFAFNENTNLAPVEARVDVRTPVDFLALLNVEADAELAIPATSALTSSTELSAVPAAFAIFEGAAALTSSTNLVANTRNTISGRATLSTQTTFTQNVRVFSVLYGSASVSPGTSLVAKTKSVISFRSTMTTESNLLASGRAFAIRTGALAASETFSTNFNGKQIVKNKVDFAHSATLVANNRVLVKSPAIALFLNGPTMRVAKADVAKIGRASLTERTALAATGTRVVVGVAALSTNSSVDVVRSRVIIRAVLSDFENELTTNTRITVQQVTVFSVFFVPVSLSADTSIVDGSKLLVKGAASIQNAQSSLTAIGRNNAVGKIALSAGGNVTRAIGFTNAPCDVAPMTVTTIISTPNPRVTIVSKPAFIVTTNTAPKATVTRFGKAVFFGNSNMAQVPDVRTPIRAALPMRIGTSLTVNTRSTIRGLFAPSARTTFNVTTRNFATRTGSAAFAANTFAIVNTKVTQRNAVALSIDNELVAVGFVTVVNFPRVFIDGAWRVVKVKVLIGGEWTQRPVKSYVDGEWVVA